MSGVWAPRTVRARNPGAISDGPWVRSHGAIGSDGLLAIFPSVAAGITAQLSLLTDRYEGEPTLDALARKYSGVDSPDYGAHLGDLLGLDPEDLGPSDGGWYELVQWPWDVAWAISVIEAGHDWLGAATFAVYGDNGITELLPIPGMTTLDLVEAARAAVDRAGACSTDSGCTRQEIRAQLMSADRLLAQAQRQLKQ